MQSQLFLNILHIFNDGYQASFLLLLPFIAKDLHISLTEVGILGSLFYSFEFIFALPAGYLAEKFEGFKILLLSMIIYAVGFLGLSYIVSYPTLMVFFIIAGTGFALFHPIAFALVAKWADKKNRGRSLGDFTAVGDLGRIGISALVTFLIVKIGWRSTSFSYAIIIFVIFLAIYFYVDRKKKTVLNIGEQTLQVIKMADILKNKRFLLATLTSFLDSLSSSTLFIFLPFLLLQKGISPEVLGSFTAAYFVGNFLGKSLIGRLTDKHGPAQVFIIAEAIMAVFIILLTNTSSLFFIIIYSIILGILTKGTIPARTSMGVESVEHHGRFEKAIALSSFLVSIASVVAPFLYGFIADKYGIASSFYTAAGIALVAIIPALIFIKSKKTALV